MIVPLLRVRFELSAKTKRFKASSKFARRCTKMHTKTKQKTYHHILLININACMPIWFEKNAMTVIEQDFVHKLQGHQFETDVALLSMRNNNLSAYINGGKVFLNHFCYGYSLSTLAF